MDSPSSKRLRSYGAIGGSSTSDMTSLAGPPASPRLFLTDILLVLFGISSWVAVNGIWVELPLLVDGLPEKWALPSYLSVIIQIANIGPILYTVARSRVRTCCGVPLDTMVVYVLLLVGSIACLLAGLFWMKTAVVAGQDHSVALFVLLFFVALLDCTSSVVYVPFTARFGSRYLTSYMIGEGLSGLLPSVVGLAQGVGGNVKCVNGTGNNSGLVPAELEPRFPVAGFFYFLFAMMTVSCIAFSLLVFLPRLDASREPVSSQQCRDPARDSPVSSGGESPRRDSSPSSRRVLTAPPTAVEVPAWGSPAFYALLVLQALVSLVSNGFLPSVQSYSVLPYGNLAFHLVATLSLMANPAACLVLAFLPVRRTLVVMATAGLSGIFAIYLLVTAAESPAPPLQDSPAGEALVVVAWVLFVGLSTYSKVGIAGLLRPWGSGALFWYGVATQAGSLVGAVVAFLAVNEFSLFTAYYPC